MEQQPEAQQKIFDLLLDKDDITWQSIIYELIRTEQMNPWDIDISLLTNRYINIIKQLKKMDFRISGKVLLAAAILLKIKSVRLVNRDITEFDSLFAAEETDDLFYEDETDAKALLGSEQIPSLIPKTPQPRQRKVSVYDLINALEKALEVKKRRVIRSIPPADIEIPQQKFKISEKISEVYSKIRRFFTLSPRKTLTFTNLIPSDTKYDKVATFIPLLHLTTQRKIDLMQREHFGEIEILLRVDREIEKELIKESVG